MTAQISPETLELAWPVLDALPFPAMQIGADYTVIAANAAAVQRYGPVQGPCYQLSHGYDVPCDRHGERCPRQMVERSRQPAAVLHVHQHGQAVERYKVTALPIRGGGILEFHIPLHDVSTVDGLTGLVNRTEGEQLVRRTLALMRRMRQGYAVVMLDLDNFKRVNDTYGHQAGDRVLKAFGRLLLHAVRETDIAARWGGEEFLVVLFGDDLAGAERFTTRLLEETRKLRFRVGDASLRITVSAGIRCVGPDESGSVRFEKVIRDADEALYHTKQTGRDRLHMHGGPAGGLQGHEPGSHAAR